jgi:glyoxylase-like metal-dependent hydrolase (beta-lactamase superfamily II)
MEIVPGIHQVDGVQGNCYIIVRDRLVLIDTGLPRNTQKITRYIRETLNRKLSELSTIIITHHHIDHTGNISELKNLSGAQVAVHEADADFVSGRIHRPLPKGGFGLLFRFMGMFLKSTAVEPDIRLKDGDIIAGLTCIHTPGHTPGSICLLDPLSKVLFVGDLLIFDGENISGPPSQFTMDMDAAKRSISRVATLDFDILLSGHRVPLKGGAAEKVRAFFKNIVVNTGAL